MEKRCSPDRILNMLYFLWSLDPLELDEKMEGKVQESILLGDYLLKQMGVNYEID